MIMKTIILGFYLIIFFNCVVNGFYNNLQNKNYLVVEIDENRLANLSDIQDFAREMGYKFKRQVTGFHNIFIFEITPSSSVYGPTNDKRSSFPSKPLNDDDRVLWSQSPIELKRHKRYDYNNYYNYDFDDEQLLNDNDLLNDYFNYRSSQARQYYAEIKKNRLFNDELWDQEWYLQDTRSRNGLPKLDLNVLPVYQRGITGNGVRVTVLDDGIEYTHDDLLPNFDPDISWNCNEDNADPSPSYHSNLNSHGTRCAGEIAMVANNRICGVGIAYGSKIGGIKLLAGMVYDLNEGMALGFAHDKVDIYSASWGPSDDGAHLERPGYLARKAIERGIREGRNGKGSIFVWASGNGGGKGDNCNCDGYASSIYTIAVGSASQRGTMPWYGEKCPATLTVTYSSGAYEDQMIATTDIGNSCTVRHTGTSASAPLAAGIIALGLEANPNLTWRDVQHIIVNTAEYIPLKNNIGWNKNAAGFFYNIRFGFGLMNADKFVTTALNWVSVDNATTVKIKSSETNLKFSTNIKQINIKLLNDKDDIKYLEHVQAELDMDYTNRGVLEFYLMSPHGTIVQLLSKRKNDNSKAGFRKWKFTSVATWSEDPQGLWTFSAIDDGQLRGTLNYGIIRSVKLWFYGTQKIPDILKDGPRKYNLTYDEKDYNEIYNSVM